MDDESSIPPKPDVILEKPNDNHYTKKIAEIKQKIEHHKKSLKEVKEQISKEKYGNNPEIEKLKKLKEELITQITPLDEELKSLKEVCKKGTEEIQKCKKIKSELTNDLEFFDLDDYNEEIKRIQKKLGFGNLNAVEEKKLIEKKRKMEEQKPKIESLIVNKKKIQELNNEFGPQLKKMREISTKLNGLYDKKKEISSKLNVIFSNKKSNDPAIKVLEETSARINQEITKNKEEITEIENEWNDKWYHYNQQQIVLDYINEANKKIALLKKKAEKDRKRREKAEKKGKTEDEEENNQVVETPKKVSYFDYEIATCQWLIKYFKDTIGEGKAAPEAAKKEEKITTQSKLADDLKSGALKVLNKDDKYPNVAGSSGFINKKKAKKENNKKATTNTFLTLDMSLISKIKELSLTPPVFIDMVKPFLKELEAKLTFYQESAQKMLKEAEPNNQETVEAAKEETVEAAKEDAVAQPSEESKEEAQPEKVEEIPVNC